MTDAMWVFPGNAKVDVILPDGTHRYWSTHCRHEDHEACSARWLKGPTVMDGVTTSIVRMPAQCKQCGAACLCSCHEPITEKEKPTDA